MNNSLYDKGVRNNPPPIVRVFTNKVNSHFPDIIDGMNVGDPIEIPRSNYLILVINASAFGREKRGTTSVTFFKRSTLREDRPKTESPWQDSRYLVVSTDFVSFRTSGLRAHSFMFAFPGISDEIWYLRNEGRVRILLNICSHFRSCFCPNESLIKERPSYFVFYLQLMQWKYASFVTINDFNKSIQSEKYLYIWGMNKLKTIERILNERCSIFFNFPILTLLLKYYSSKIYRVDL